MSSRDKHPVTAASAAPRRFWLAHPSRFGRFVIVWDETPEGLRIRQVQLKRSGRRPPCGAAGRDATVRELAGRIAAFLEGAIVEFDLRPLAWEQCTRFQQRVLRAESRVPRGCVTTYGRIAAVLGVSCGARAVGAALATNPFPILIPCHRAIRSDGSLGGYQGGVSMKRALLVQEGVEVAPGGRVVAPREYDHGTTAGGRV